MKFAPTDLPGVLRVSLRPVADARGFFARLHAPEDFAAAGSPFVPVQTSLSRNDAAFTLRGLHFQAPPHEEAKLVRVVRGAVYDVVVDLRRDSPSYKR
jgi:dTDP-4-dehydrorhamnose 3,5-epimerase